MLDSLDMDTFAIVTCMLRDSKGSTIRKLTKYGLTSSTSAYKAQVVEAGHLVLHNTWGIPELSWIILIIPSHYCDHRPISNLSQGHHLRREQWCTVLHRACVHMQDALFCSFFRQFLWVLIIISKIYANVHIYADLIWKEIYELIIIINNTICYYY